MVRRTFQMCTPRFVTIAFAVLSLCKTQVALGQNTSDSEANEHPSQYTLRDISERGSPLRVVGKVLFRGNPAVLTYEVEAAVKNVSKKNVLSWSVLVRTSDGVLSFTSSSDYFFTGDALAPDDSAGVNSGPLRLVAHPQGDAPKSGERDSSKQALTTSAEIEFVQFQDGSTWGDTDAETEAFRVRSATLHKLESLQRVYAEHGEKAFLDALAEPTMLGCVERVKTDCKANNDNSSCSRGAIQRMLDAAAHRRFLEKTLTVEIRR
jgi:hypothetical protein